MPNGFFKESDSKEIRSENKSKGYVRKNG